MPNKKMIITLFLGTILLILSGMALANKGPGNIYDYVMNCLNEEKAKLDELTQSSIKDIVYDCSNNADEAFRNFRSVVESCYTSCGTDTQGWTKEVTACVKSKCAALDAAYVEMYARHENELPRSYSFHTYLTEKAVEEFKQTLGELPQGEQSDDWDDSWGDARYDRIEELEYKEDLTEEEILEAIELFNEIIIEETIAGAEMEDIYWLQEWAEEWEARLKKFRAAEGEEKAREDGEREMQQNKTEKNKNRTLRQGSDNTARDLGLENNGFAYQMNREVLASPKSKNIEILQRVQPIKEESAIIINALEQTRALITQRAKKGVDVRMDLLHTLSEEQYKSYQRLDELKGELGKIILENPDNVEANFELAKIYQIRLEDDKASVLYQRALIKATPMQRNLINAELEEQFLDKLRVNQDVFHNSRLIFQVNADIEEETKEAPEEEADIWKQIDKIKHALTYTNLEEQARNKISQIIYG